MHANDACERFMRTIVIPDKDCYYVDPCLMNPCDDFSTCRMDEDNEEGFSCPCMEYDGQINRIGDGRKSGPGNVVNKLIVNNNHLGS